MGSRRTFFRGDDAVVVTSTAFVTVNGPSKALQHKINTARIWSQRVAGFCRSFAEDFVF